MYNDIVDATNEIIQSRVWIRSLLCSHNTLTSIWHIDLTDGYHPNNLDSFNAGTKGNDAIAQHQLNKRTQQQ